MVPSSRRRRLAALALAAALGAGTAGCWRTARRAELPDLSPIERRIQTLHADADRLSEARLRQLQALHDQREALIAAAPALWEAEVPRRRFKHTAMACLNDPATAEPMPGSPPTLAAESLGLACVTEPLPSLIEATPATARPALTRALRQVDELRTLRATLRRELREEPEYLRRARATIAELRAEVRSAAFELERRRPEFNDDELQRSLRALDAHAQALDALEARLVELATDRPRIEDQIAQETRQLYRELTLL